MNDPKQKGHIRVAATADDVVAVSVVVIVVVAITVVIEIVTVSATVRLLLQACL